MATLRQRNNSMPYGIERKIRISMEEKIDPRITNLIKAYEKTLDNIDKNVESVKENIEKEIKLEKMTDKEARVALGWIEALEYVLVLTKRERTQGDKIIC
jgi:cell division protein FtsB